MSTKDRYALFRALLPFAAMACMAGLSGCGKQNETAGHTKSGTGHTDTTAIKVVTTDLRASVFDEWGTFSAELRGSDDVVLYAPYQGGKVLSIKEVGSSAHTGDPLCSIDEEKYQVVLDAAKAQLTLTAGDLDRAKVNVENGSIGKSAADGAQLAYQNARLMMVNAKAAWEDCRGQSPFDGMIVSRMVDRYQTVAPGTPLMRVARIDQLQAIIAIPEAEAFSYTEGMATEFCLLQNSDTRFEGTIKSIERIVDSRSRTITARIMIKNIDRMLKPGMVGRARILKQHHENAIVIPSVALVRLQNSITVMVAEQGVARQRTVMLGATAGDSTLVTSGLSAGDKLIVVGAFQVSNGTRVTY